MADTAVAQTIPQGTFKHIIIVVQENRTPDNLFGAGSGVKCGGPDPFMPGVDIDNGGYGRVWTGNPPGLRQLMCNMPLPLNGWDADLFSGNPIGMIDPDHSHNSPPSRNPNCPYGPPCGWVADYDSGAMDGFCHGYGNSAWPHPCPSYSYVQTGVRNDSGWIGPYFQIAETYSFGNYMFQTNEGPSFEAHQFLFTGTSAPVAPNQNYDNYNLDFVAENLGSDYGCPQKNQVPKWVDPTGTEIGGDQSIAECYAHDSLVTAAVDCPPNNEEGYCDRSGITWGYYAPPATGSQEESIWIAPLANPQTCYGSSGPQGTACPAPAPPSYSEYTTHVHLPGSPVPWNPPAVYSSAPIFDDLINCHLPQISWVIPDQMWSDHPWLPGKPQNSWALGAYWVGDIIDAVGSACQGKYWSGSEPTAVFVTWDDWGGWYDHIPPWAVYRGTSTSCPPTPPYNVPNGWGCGYVSGFRVPLLVVSPWTGTGNQQTGYTPYVSGACSPSTCPNFGTNNVYVHDFGSILAFTEWNFGFSPEFIANPDYADYNAPDWGGNPPPNNTTVPLLDFFQLPLNQPRPFTSIDTGEWPYQCFKNWGGSNNGTGNCPGATGETYVAEDPDDD
jgi:phospholipase C